MDQEIAEAVAAGKVTKCPPAYCAPVTGAARLTLPEPAEHSMDWRRNRLQLSRRALTPAQVAEIKRLREDHVPMAVLVRRFGVSRVTIWKELNRR